MNQNAILESLSCTPDDHVSFHLNEPITMKMVNAIQKAAPGWMVVWRSVTGPAGGQEWLDLRRSA